MCVCTSAGTYVDVEVQESVLSALLDPGLDSGYQAQQEALFFFLLSYCLPSILSFLLGLPGFTSVFLNVTPQTGT